VRRRAVISLAPFDSPDVTAALRAALSDRDWQVRQAAEDLLAAAGLSDSETGPDES
jgi:HEAT repeat protein